MQMVSCDWQEVTLPMKAEWRCALTISGVLYVETPGELQMLLWCVDSWDIPLKVSLCVYKLKLVDRNDDYWS